MFKIYDGREQFYQWDLNRKLIVYDETIKEVHFCNRTDNCSLTRQTYTIDGIHLVDVPDILLQTDWRINVYAYDGKYTKHSACFKVVSRTKPENYVFTDTEVSCWNDLDQRVVYLEQNDKLNEEYIQNAIDEYITENFIDVNEKIFLGQTPITLTENAKQVSLKSEGETTFTAQSYTVADYENAAAITNVNTSVYKEDEITKVVITGSVATWHQNYLSITLTGFTVGETYTLVLDGTDCPVQSNGYLACSIRVFDEKDNAITELPLKGLLATFNSFDFVATGSTVKIRFYPTNANTFGGGYRTGYFRDLYVNRAGAPIEQHTEIIDKSGVFEGEVVLAGMGAGTTITTSSKCYVYMVAGEDTEEDKENLKTSRHSGKICVCFGDSITGNAKAPNDYPTIIAKETGMEVINGGFGGCHMSSNHSQPYHAAFSMVKLADAIVTGDWTLQDEQVGDMPTTTNSLEHLEALKSVDWEAVDFITIAYGTNDINSLKALDNEDDKQDTTTYLGALRYSLTRILSVYPQIKVLLLTPIYRYWIDEGVDSDTKTFKDDKRFVDWCDGMKEVAEEFKVPVVDMYRTLGFNAITRGYYFPSTDGTHPNPNGLKVIGGKIAAKLLSEY